MGDRLFTGYRVSIWDDENVPELVLVMIAQYCECAINMSMPLNFALKNG